MKGQVARGTLVLGVQQVIAFAAMMLLHVGTGRYFGPEIYGLFSVIHAILMLVAFMFLMGIPQAVTRATAEHPESARSLLHQGLVLQLGLSVPLALLLHAGAELLAEVLGNARLVGPIQLGAWMLPGTAVVFVCAQSLNGLHWFGRQAVVLATLNVFKVAAVLAFLATGAGVTSAVRGLVFATTATTIVAWWATRGVPGVVPRPASGLLRVGAQMSGTLIAVALWERVDLLMLEWLGDVPGEVGLFSAASALTAAPGTLLVPVMLAIFPAISRATAAGSRGDVAWYIGEAVAWSYRVLCPMAIAAFFVGSDLLGVFYGSAYLPAAFAVGPLVLSTLFYALYELFDTWMRSSGRSSQSWRLAGVLLLVHVALNAFFIPRYQLAGVVLTTVVSGALAALATGIPLLRAVRLRPRFGRVVRPPLAAAIAYAPLAFFGGDDWARLALAAGLTVVYFGLLFVLRELGREELNRARALAGLGPTTAS